MLIRLTCKCSQNSLITSGEVGHGLFDLAVDFLGVDGQSLHYSFRTGLHIRLPNAVIGIKAIHIAKPKIQSFVFLHLLV